MPLLPRYMFHYMLAVSLFVSCLIICVLPYYLFTACYIFAVTV